MCVGYMLEVIVRNVVWSETISIGMKDEQSIVGVGKLCGYGILADFVICSS